MEEINVPLSGGGELKALRLQDLPAEHVIAFLGMPSGMKEHMAMKLFQLAVGPAASVLVSGMTFGELQDSVSEWLILSADAEDDGAGAGLDWSELLR